MNWRDIGGDYDSFETRWKPGKWNHSRRFVFVRQLARIQDEQPLQLDLFKPRDDDFCYKVIMTNKRDRANQLLHYHNGRGAQESIFAELKSENSLGHRPTRTWRGNQVFLRSTVLAHNLTRKLQMPKNVPIERNGAKRPTLWVFERLDTIRQKIIRRADRLMEPDGG